MDAGVGVVKLKHACVDPGQYGLNIPASEYVPSGIRLIRTSDLSDAGLSDASDGIFVPGPVEDRFLLREGDLLLSRSGTVGRSFLAPAEANGSTFAGFLVRFRPSDRTDPRFLSYVARSGPFQGTISSDALVSTIQNFNADKYANISIPNLPIEEQTRIADFLDEQVFRIDDIIAARRGQIAELRSLGMSRLQGMADEQGRAHGWTRLRHALRTIEQGWSPQADARPAADDEWGVMRSGCVNGGVFRESDNKALPGGLAARAEYELRPGDLLLSRASGSMDLIGSVAVVPADARPRLILCDKIYRLTPAEGWLPEFLAPMLRTTQNRQLIRLGVSGAEGMANNLPTGVIRDLLVPRTPTRHQAAVVVELAEDGRVVTGTVQASERSIELLNEYKQSLITAAVTGELDVSAASGRIPA
jgi:type I restriction enzyme S subunit